MLVTQDERKKKAIHSKMCTNKENETMKKYAFVEFTSFGCCKLTCIHRPSNLNLPTSQTSA